MKRTILLISLIILSLVDVNNLKSQTSSLNTSLDFSYLKDNNISNSYVTNAEITNYDMADSTDIWYKKMLDISDMLFEHKIIGGFNVGATAPFPIPNKFSNFVWEPTFTPYLGWEFSLYDNKYIGFTAGVVFSKKGMKAEADVYQIYTNVIVDNVNVEGYFTGRNKTIVDNIYVSLPMMFTYNKINYKIDFGASFNYLLMGNFKGEVKDGYIRIGEPTGPKTEVDLSTYEFNDNIKKFEICLEGRFERKIYRNLHLSAGISCSVKTMMKEDFKGLEEKFRNLYTNVGLVYYISKLEKLY